MIKLSDYIFSFLYERGVRDVFMLPGGGAMHLVDSLGNSKVNYIHCHHEQAAAIAALAYGEHTNHLGVCLVTSGPGATNTITGVTAAWIDSVPMMVISGQAKRKDLIGDKGVRQIGSQEVSIVDIISPVTKYAAQILDPTSIRYHLERAYFEATTGRKGPVWLDIPLDIQAHLLDESGLDGFIPEAETQKDYSSVVKDILEKIRSAKRPLILAGNGIYSANAVNLFEKLENQLRIPVQTTWKAIDLSYEDHPLYAGHPGTLGDRGANYIIQKSDLLLSLGARIDNSITAFNEPAFAPNAYKVVVDIDENELNKFSMHIDMPVHADVYDIIDALLHELGDDYIEKADWLTECKAIREKYPIVTQSHRNQKDSLSGYYFTECLSNALNDGDVIVPESAGVTVEATLQAFRSKPHQRNKHAAGLGSMGFGLPYSIGACIANGCKRTILINGDGAFQLNIQELETLHRLDLPVKIFIWSNQGYASIRGMQRNNFSGNYVASDSESGCTIPDIKAIAEAYGIKTYGISVCDDIERRIKEVLDSDGVSLCVVEIDPEEIVSPKVVSTIAENGQMVPGTLDNMWPFIKN